MTKTMLSPGRDDKSNQYPLSVIMDQMQTSHNQTAIPAPDLHQAVTAQENAKPLQNCLQYEFCEQGALKVYLHQTLQALACLPCT